MKDVVLRVLARAKRFISSFASSVSLCERVVRCVIFDEANDARLIFGHK